MKTFFNEYGKAIVSAVVVISLISVAVAMKAPVQNSLNDMVGDWANSTASAVLTIEGVNVGSSGSSGSDETSKTYTITAVPDGKMPVGSVDGNNATLDASSDASFHSEAEYSSFSSVKVDGSTIEPSNYDASEGSIIVTLKKEYLATLTTGEHEIEIVSTDGSAKTNFNIEIQTPVSFISFAIDSIEYQAVKGMTWDEWINSEYNIDEYKTGMLDIDFATTCAPFGRNPSSNDVVATKSSNYSHSNIVCQLREGYSTPVTTTEKIISTDYFTIACED